MLRRVVIAGGLVVAGAALATALSSNVSSLVAGRHAALGDTPVATVDRAASQRALGPRPESAARSRYLADSEAIKTLSDVNADTRLELFQWAELAAKAGKKGYVEAHLAAKEVIKPDEWERAFEAGMSLAEYNAILERLYATRSEDEMRGMRDSFPTAGAWTSFKAKLTKDQTTRLAAGTMRLVEMFNIRDDAVIMLNIPDNAVAAIPDKFTPLTIPAKVG